MRKLKIALVSIASIFAVLYLAFLFVIPNVLNLNNYKQDIQKLVEDNVKLKIDASNIKLVTTPRLAAGIRIDGLKLAYPDDTEFLSVDSASVKLKLVPFLWKTFQLDSINVDSPKYTLTVLENGDMDILDFINKNLNNGVPAQDASTTTAPVAPVEFPVNISAKMPKVTVKNYEFTAKDQKTGNTVKVKGDSFVFDKAVMNKHFRVASNGKILLNDKENVNYSAKIDSYWPVIAAGQPAEAEEFPMDINFINEIIKFDLKADLDTDLKIRENKDSLKINGHCNIDKLSAKLDGQKLPDSFAHIAFKGNEIKIDSDFSINDAEKATVKANIINGKKFSMDLNVIAEKISFVGIQKFVVSLLNSFNIKNDLNQYVMAGYLESDFTLKTDLKNFASNGFFRAHDGSISHKSLPVSIQNIAADVDFSNNNVNIKNAGALVGGARFDVKGTIDSKSNADISVVSNSIPLNSLYTVLAPKDIKSAYDLQDGILTLNVAIKGKLAEIAPKIALNLSNLKIKDKANGLLITNRLTEVDIVTKGDSFNGNIDASGSQVLVLGTGSGLSVPNAQVLINPKDITITPFNIMVESSAIKVAGGVKNYMKKPDINITANGNINTADLKKLLPADARALVSTSGSLPLNVLVAGDDKNLSVNAQVASDSSNHFSVVNISKMTGKPGLVNVALTMKDNTLKIEDIGLYIMSKVYTNTFKSNVAGADKIASVEGAIGDLNAKVQTLKKIEVSVPSPLQVSTPLMAKSSLKARGRISANGKLTAPSIKGFFELKEINVPEYLTKVDLVNVNFNDTVINADAQNLNINGSQLNIKADASTKFNGILIVNSLNLNSPSLDLDKLLLAMETPDAKKIAASQPPVGSGPMIPVKINKGYGEIGKFKMGDIIATNATSSFTLNNDLLKLTDLKATAFDGPFWGVIDYNLKTLAMKANVHGKSMDANNAIVAGAGKDLKDQVKGTLSFDADITLKGATYEEQMRTLNGKASFKVDDGQMGTLGRFETFLQAGNLASNTFVSTSIGSLINTVAPYNTGKFVYLMGDVNLINGVAQFVPIKSSGPYMSLYITGSMNILANTANMEILGSLAPEINKVLGPVGDLSIDKLSAFIPKVGTAVSAFMNTFNATANDASLAKIPQLTPEKTGTKSFKVALNGSLLNPPKMVKSFQWLNSTKTTEEAQASLKELLSPKEALKEILKVPTNKEDLKNELKQQLQDKLQNQIQGATQAKPEVQKAKESETAKNLQGIYNIYKDIKKQPE